MTHVLSNISRRYHQNAWHNNYKYPADIYHIQISFRSSNYTILLKHCKKCICTLKHTKATRALIKTNCCFSVPHQLYICCRMFCLHIYPLQRLQLWHFIQAVYLFHPPHSKSALTVQFILVNLSTETYLRRTAKAL